MNIIQPTQISEKYQQISNPLPHEFQGQNLVFKNLDPSIIATTALCVVDLQNAFLHPEGCLVQAGIMNPEEFHGNHVVSSCEDWIDIFRELNLPICYLQWISRPDFSPKAMANYDMSEFDIDLHRLQPLDDEPVFQKGGNSGFDNSELLPYFNQQNINHIVMCGLFLGACVTATAEDAINHGLSVSLALDANEPHNKIPNQIQQSHLKSHYIDTSMGKNGMNIISKT
jgi:nicotinamidase-related amidase